MEGNDWDKAIYVDGLMQRGIVDRIDDDLFRINLEWYREGLKYIERTKTEFKPRDDFDLFNIAMGRAMLDRFEFSLTNEELERYTDTMMQAFAACGLYEEIFGKDWEKVIDERSQ